MAGPTQRATGDFPWSPIFARATLFVCDELGINEEDLISPRRQPHLVRARALWVWIVKHNGPGWLSYPIIGHWLGGRDHSGIMHLFKEHAEMLHGCDPAFAALCTKFQQKEAVRCLQQ